MAPPEQRAHLPLRRASSTISQGLKDGEKEIQQHSGPVHSWFCSVEIAGGDCAATRVSLESGVIAVESVAAVPGLESGRVASESPAALVSVTVGLGAGATVSAGVFADGLRTVLNPKIAPASSVAATRAAQDHPPPRRIPVVASLDDGAARERVPSGSSSGRKRR